MPCSYSRTNRGPRRIHGRLVQHSRNFAVHLPGVAEMRRGVTADAEHQHLTLPDRLVPEHLHDMLSSEEPSLDAVGLADGVTDRLWELGELVELGNRN